jgi:RNA polymerase-binding transcription factor DksA
MADYAAAERILKARFDELNARVAALDKALQAPLSADFEEQAGDLEGQDALVILEEQALREIGTIKAALNRIARGTYGICATCGEAIPAKRLDAVPTALRCVTCEQQS